MNFSKKIVYTGIASLILVLGLYSFKPVNKTLDESAYNNETLFKGIFFGTGQVGKYLTESSICPIAVSRNAAEEETLLNAVKAYSPGFLDRFRKDMESGDRKLIKASIKEGLDLLRQNAKYPDTTGPIIIGTPVFVDGGVTAYPGPTVGAITSTNKIRSTLLHKEMLVNQIAVTLGKNK